MKLRCFARCERRGECRGAVKGSAALQFRLTMIDRSREPLLKCELSMLQTGGSAPLPGRGLYAHSRNRPCGLPVRISDSVCELVGTHAGCLRRPGRFAPSAPGQEGPAPGRADTPHAAIASSRIFFETRVYFFRFHYILTPCASFLTKNPFKL